MKSTLILLSLFMVFVNANVLEENLNKIANVRTGSGFNSRKPRLFLVTTASTTSTFRTRTLCYSSAGNTPPSGTCKRKRSISIDSIDDLVEPAPSRSNLIIDSGFENDEDFVEGDLNHRAARQNFFNFLLYWATTTSTSTFTSFTRTGTLTLNGGCIPDLASQKCPGA